MARSFGVLENVGSVKIVKFRTFTKAIDEPTFNEIISHKWFRGRDYITFRWDSQNQFLWVKKDSEGKEVEAFTFFQKTRGNNNVWFRLPIAEFKDGVPAKVDTEYLQELTEKGEWVEGEEK